MDEIDDLVDAAVWAEKRGGGKIFKESAFRHSVRKRILSGGSNKEDAQNLLDWRAAKHKPLTGKPDENRKQAVGRDHLSIDPVASEKGARLLSGGFLEKIAMQECFPIQK